jgi:hypothetical protein
VTASQEAFDFRHEQIAEALECVAAAQLELAADNRMAQRRLSPAVTEETIISLAQALIHVVDAKGNRNSDRALRAALVMAIEIREAPDVDR